PFTSRPPFVISSALMIAGFPGTRSPHEWKESVAELMITISAASAIGSYPETSGVYGSVTILTGGPPLYPGLPSIRKQACPYHLTLIDLPPEPEVLGLRR